MNKLPFILNERELSEAAFKYCQINGPDELVKKYITKSEYAYFYCLKIENDPEVRKYIKDEKFAFAYCWNIENCSEVRCNISNKYLLQLLKDGKINLKYK